MSHGSLAYRRNEAEIRAGVVPEKYRRLMPHITGRTILEIGAAEGVLSLLLADRDPSALVTALEMHQGRHEDGLALQAKWREMGRRVDGCTMVLGDIRNRLDLLYGIETLVAIRTIYHLRESIHEVFACVGETVPRVVLAGNPNRAKWPKFHTEKDSLGEFNRYASVPGMVEVLERAGYMIDTVVKEGDPIVTGRR